MIKHLFSLILILLLLTACTSSSPQNTANTSEDLSCNNYRAAMRDFVIEISNTARQTKASFIVIPQNGQNVAWDDDNADTIIPDKAFFDAIDGTGREDVFYGMNSKYEIADGYLTPENLSQDIQDMCDIYLDAGKAVLSIDYTTSNQSKINDSFHKNDSKQYISFAATKRKLNEIPFYQPHNHNTASIHNLNDAKNFLYLINPEKYSSKESFIKALEETDYDILLLDLFCGDQELNSYDLQRLRNKASDESRLLICYMSIGEAEDYRWYWQSSWNNNPPAFLCAENDDWQGNYKVKYWYPDWQEIICGKDGYLAKILAAGFDGVYLDIIDAFEYFEEDKKNN